MSLTTPDAGESLGVECVLCSCQLKLQICDSSLLNFIVQKRRGGSLPAVYLSHYLKHKLYRNILLYYHDDSDSGDGSKMKCQCTSGRQVCRKV